MRFIATAIRGVLLINRIESRRWASFLSFKYIANTDQTRNASRPSALEVQQNASFILRQIHSLWKLQMVNYLVSRNINTAGRFASRRIFVGKIVIKAGEILLKCVFKKMLHLNFLSFSTLNSIYGYVPYRHQSNHSPLPRSQKAECIPLHSLRRFAK